MARNKKKSTHTRQTTFYGLIASIYDKKDTNQEKKILESMV